MERVAILFAQLGRLKFIYYEKATKFWEIFPLLLTTVHTVKSKKNIWTLKASEDTITNLKSQALHVIRMKYWKADESGNPPSFIRALWNIGILPDKQANQGKHFCPECIYTVFVPLKTTD